MDGRPGDRAYISSNGAVPSTQGGATPERAAAGGEAEANGATAGAATGAGSGVSAGSSAGAAGTAAAPEGTRVSPVAARAAAVEGVDLAGVPGVGPAGRITKSDVLSAAANGGTVTDGVVGEGVASNGQPERRRRNRGARRLGVAQGRRRGAGALHGAVALDPHRHELPHARRHRPRRAPPRAQGVGPQGVVHSPDRLRDRVRAASDMPVMATTSLEPRASRTGSWTAR